jgi:hypothetical protein
MTISLLSVAPDHLAVGDYVINHGQDVQVCGLAANLDERMVYARMDDGCVWRFDMTKSVQVARPWKAVAA